MNSRFADRITDVPRSFIREILKTTISKDVISFAGGLPNRDLFPVREIKDASVKVLDMFGSEVLQYSTSEGYLPLREWICRRYKEKNGLDVAPDQIIITTGSQQGLDLIGKTLINDFDNVGIEEPGYLGAIQAFSLYRPVFKPIKLTFDGLDIDELNGIIDSDRLKVIYTVPNFQNPSGVTHKDYTRDKVSDLLKNSRTFIIEDNPYGELQFSGEKQKSYYARIPGNAILLGSFSKIFVPSFRIGWIAAPPALTEKLIVAKQASDLHTNYFAQRVLFQYLEDNDIDEHIKKINAKYYSQKEAMIKAIQKYFPEQVKYSNPDGGMFLWGILPDKISALKVFEKAIKQNVAFVPGDPFYVNKRDVNTMRLNFSCVDENIIESGIRRLGNILKEFC